MDLTRSQVTHSNIVHAILLSTVVLGCADVQLPSEVARTQGVQVRRTSFGIPHIEAADERGLGFGTGYSFAQDNLCLLAEEMVTVNGERSLYFGAEATYEPSSDGTSIRNLASDVYYTLINDPDRVAASWASQPPEIQNLIVGYAHGVNRFLHDAAGALPDACRGEPWVREISELDVVRLMRRFAVEGSGVRMIEAIFAARPPVVAPAATEPLSLRDTELANAPIWDGLQTSLGSNGIALGRDVTASHAGLLLASPHFPWRGVFRFYELHLVIPGKLDAMGATPAGLPVVGIGHNADVAWTHTVNSSLHFTFHQLTLDPADPTRYIVNGESRPMSATDVAVKVRLPGGEIGTVAHRVWSSELGPIVVIPGAFGWTAGAAFSFGDANADNTRFLQAWYQIDQARSLGELRSAVEDTLGIPWVNTIAVDAGGTTYLGSVTPVPNVPSDARCIPAGFGPLAQTGTVVLDGSTSSCNWQIVSSTPTPGILPAAQLPTLERTDFVQNSNDSAWLTNPASPLTGFPAIVSRAGIPQNARTRLGLTYLTGEIADGRQFTTPGLLDFAFSNLAFHAKSLLADLRQLCLSPDAFAVQAQCALLSGWDRKANLKSVGWPLYLAWRKALDAAAVPKRLDFSRVPFDPADPIGTPRGLRISDPVVATTAISALVQAAASLDASFIDPTRPWGELQQTERGGRRIPIHGGGGDRTGGRSDDTGNEIYNKINSRVTDGRLEPFFGTSIVMAISFEGGTPATQGLLTYSQSSDPASPHFADQTERFSRKEWISFPYTEDAIVNDPNLTVTELTE
jgi:acyl-homoserine-lactone acylase